MGQKGTVKIGAKRDSIIKIKAVPISPTKGLIGTVLLLLKTRPRGWYWTLVYGVK